MASPERYCAFFDVDGTLVRFKTMFEFERFYHVELYGAPGLARYEAFCRELRALDAAGVPREELNRRFYRAFRGRSVAAVDAVAAHWAARIAPGFPSAWVTPVVEALAKHRARGAEIVLVSGSFPAVLLPIAERLGAHAVLCTRLEVDEGVYTGELEAQQTIGHGKALVVASHMADAGAHPRACWAYGDHVSDVPMLASVGHPVVVGEDPPILAVAEEHGWPVLSAEALMGEAQNA